MNPLTNVKNITKMNEKELEMGTSENASWHQMYKDSSWIFFGGVDSDLTEGDLICVFSQWGEVVNIHLIRDRTTGRSKGFGFLAYYNQKSTVLAVDNANGIKLCGRIMRVDHCENYKIPKNLDKMNPETRELIEKGCAPQPICVRKADDDELKDTDKKKKKIKEEDSSSGKKSKRRGESIDERRGKKKSEDSDEIDIEKNSSKRRIEDDERWGKKRDEENDYRKSRKGEDSEERSKESHHHKKHKDARRRDEDELIYRRRDESSSDDEAMNRRRDNRGIERRPIRDDRGAGEIVLQKKHKDDRRNDTDSENERRSIELDHFRIRKEDLLKKDEIRRNAEEIRKKMLAKRDDGRRNEFDRRDDEFRRDNYRSKDDFRRNEYRKR